MVHRGSTIGPGAHSSFVGVGIVLVKFPTHVGMVRSTAEARAGEWLEVRDGAQRPSLFSLVPSGDVILCPRPRRFPAAVETLRVVSYGCSVHGGVCSLAV